MILVFMIVSTSTDIQLHIEEYHSFVIKAIIALKWSGLLQSRSPLMLPA
jgi:hypothetical protein